MKLISALKFVLVIIIPAMIFLLAMNAAGFDNSFYSQKFSEYGVDKNIPKAGLIHQKVMDFIKGNSDDLPAEFNEKEKQHLLDVRKLIGFGTALMYILILLFILLLVLSAFTLKASTYVNMFVGKVLLFGGLLTLGLALLIFALISADFDSSFESFHKLFFDYGTYSFDSGRELIVNLYPEQLFMDLGIRVSKWVIVSAILVAIIGLFFLLRSKRNK